MPNSYHGQIFIIALILINHAHVFVAVLLPTFTQNWLQDLNMTDVK